MLNTGRTIDTFRPMLAASFPCTKKDCPTEEDYIKDLKKLNWTNGFWVSPKIDGIRAIKHPQMGLVSRTLKPIRNKHIQSLLSSAELDFLDGELIKGKLEDLISFNDNQSAIMSADGSPPFTFCVFDDITQPLNPFNYRHLQALGRTAAFNKSNVICLEQAHVKNIDELLKYEEGIIADGFEGVIIRDPFYKYKNNRSTYREQGMIKMKRFVDAEAIVTGFVELYRNKNEPTIDNLGYQKRSQHQANQQPAGTLGKLLVKGINGRFRDVDFSVGSGLDDDLRSTIWNNKADYLNKIVKYKFQDHGSKDAPRTPIFLGFRHEDDL